MNYEQIAKDMKTDSFRMAGLSAEIRNRALAAIGRALRENSGAIFAANEQDLARAKADNLALPIIGRLKFDEHKLSDVLSGIDELTRLPDPLLQTLLKRQLDDNLTLVKTTCPIGVIGVIFESRPDALVQISSLCIKSGNCAILKGGSEAAETNRILFDTIRGAGLAAGLPDGFLALVESRAGIDALLKCHDSIDLLIPRGSNQFVQYIMANSKIPVMGHADGVCHIYVDRAADPETALPIIIDAKTQYAAACNAVETLLCHREAADTFLPRLAEAAADRKITLRCEAEAADILSRSGAQGWEPVSDDDLHIEYLDYFLSVKVVNNIEEAIAHINRYGSHHTDCIVTEDPAAADRFMADVDSAGVYQNCSTRFADGFRYGFGAEVGISTGKLHARGPVGLDGLVTYKYKLYGNGQIVADYAEGRSTFKFKDLTI